MRLAAIDPHFAGLRLLQLNLADSHVTLGVAPTRRTAPGPSCHQKSSQRQTQYTRTLSDRPRAGRSVKVRLGVRRFRCRNRACPRRSFAERFPKLAAVKARPSIARRVALADYGFAEGGAPGARLANDQGLEGSRRTILRAVHTTPLPSFPTPRVLGVEDWAWRKGQSYGTILVDLDNRWVVDLLEDGTAAPLARRLANHEGVEVIARDGGGVYADGARQGAPDAIQVADRFHLIVRRFIRYAIPIADGKGSEGGLWVNGLPCGESQRGQP